MKAWQALTAGVLGIFVAIVLNVLFWGAVVWAVCLILRHFGVI